MNIVALYKEKLFYQVIINSGLCLCELDYICVYLSLVGIGRRREAVLLLRAKAESGLDPPIKICVLLCLYEITGNLEFSIESDYWQSLGDFDDTIFQSLKPIPQSSSNIMDCTSKFTENGAFFHPHSYSYTYLTDFRVAIGMTDIENPEALILQTIEKCGSTSQIANAISQEKIKSYFVKSQETIDLAGTDADISESVVDGLNSASCISALACYYHLLEKSPNALHYCTEAINLINSIRIKFGTSNLKGISDYEKETIVMLASHHLSDDSSGVFVESLLNELMYPELAKRPVEERLGPNTNSFHQIARATLLRQSFFFASCGNIYRSLAHQNSSKLTFMIKERSETGIIYVRDDMLESTRKYVLSTALQPIDNPYLYQHYDRVIWCLLLCGGIDIRVILLFFTIRNHYYHNKGMSLIEINSGNSLIPWPRFINGSEILHEFFGKCLRISRIDPEGTDMFSPTILDCDDHVVLLKCFLRDPHTLSYDKLHDTDTLNPLSRENTTEIELHYLMSSSQEIAEIWTSTFRKAQGEIPNEIRQVTRYFNI